MDTTEKSSRTEPPSWLEIRARGIYLYTFLNSTERVYMMPDRRCWHVRRGPQQDGQYTHIITLMDALIDPWPLPSAAQRRKAKKRYRGAGG